MLTLPPAVRFGVTLPASESCCAICAAMLNFCASALFGSSG